MIREIYSLQGHAQGITCSKFLPKGKILATGSQDKSIKVWGVSHDSGKLSFDYMQTLYGHSASINCLAWASEPLYLVSASDDCTIVVWNIVDAKKVYTLRVPAPAVYVACNPNSTIVASASMENAIRLWDLHDGECLVTVAAHSKPITSIEFSNDGQVFMSSSFDGFIRLWETSTGHCLRTLVANTKERPPISGCCFINNCQNVIAASLDSCIRILSTSTGSIIKTFTGHHNKAHILSFACDSSESQLVCGSDDGSLWVYDMRTEKVLSSVKSMEIDGLISSIENIRLKCIDLTANDKMYFAACSANSPACKIFEICLNK